MSRIGGHFLEFSISSTLAAVLATDILGASIMSKVEEEEPLSS